VRPALRNGRAVARIVPTVGSGHSLGVRRKLGRVGPLAAVVQIGTGYAVPGVVPVATFEDLTVAQAISVQRPYPGWERLSPREVAARMRRQHRAYERATACCVSTSWAARSVVEDYGVAPDKVSVVGLGRNSEPEPVERDWTTPRFLFVGLDWEGKNGPAVLRAFARVRAAHPDAELHVVGGHPALDAPGVTGHGVLMMGDPAQARRLAELFEQATCFVMPSHHEAAGIAYIEAMSTGLPSIGTTVGGPADIIGDAGTVVDPRDDAALAAAMGRFADPAIAPAVGRRALARASLFTWKAVAGRILDALGLPPAGSPQPDPRPLQLSA
jgi:glycosyltransferase involved in cell wall biosynthesis